LIAVAFEDDTVGIWNHKTSRLQDRFKPDLPPTNLQFSSDGRMLAGWNKPVGQTWIWQVTDKVCELRLPPELKNSVMMSFAPNGWVATGNNVTGDIAVWDLESLQRLQVYPAIGARGSLTFSEDSRFMAVCDGSVSLKVIDLASSKVLPYFQRSDVPTSCLTFSRDGKTLATGHTDGTVHFWNLVTGHDLGSIRAHQEVVLSIGLLPDHRGLITAGIGCNSRCEATLWSTE
jgi:WD40 repeat protein